MCEGWPITGANALLLAVVIIKVSHYFDNSCVIYEGTEPKQSLIRRLNSICCVWLHHSYLFVFFYASFMNSVIFMNSGPVYVTVQYSTVLMSRYSEHYSIIVLFYWDTLLMKPRITLINLLCHWHGACLAFVSLIGIVHPK